ncbi:hypothetical protein BABINDRAFT_169294 [Babjeviella inositovora NRRL Y-12698]|uniref:GATA-type domain-containing protein n=1 Tax=Babjeviella inositovora NRRL Y-12698 TaxID=984486 RepID=A0A1E3QHJ3_9ASCO|nr:uncharacterized protein BABINDRAFT_169294 [Babjeviella inositovora NRRL Y-12698]ODQ77165.1 hypothetical protein BABINDRAFT_169294 [Babjeviella inositovora NRRL Y-12698]
MNIFQMNPVSPGSLDFTERKFSSTPPSSSIGLVSPPNSQVHRQSLSLPRLFVSSKPFHAEIQLKTPVTMRKRSFDCVQLDDPLTATRARDDQLTAKRARTAPPSPPYDANQIRVRARSSSPLRKFARHLSSSPSPNPPVTLPSFAHIQQRLDSVLNTIVPPASLEYGDPYKQAASLLHSSSEDVGRYQASSQGLSAIMQATPAATPQVRAVQVTFGLMTQVDALAARLLSSMSKPSSPAATLNYPYESAAAHYTYDRPDAYTHLQKVFVSPETRPSLTASPAESAAELVSRDLQAGAATDGYTANGHAYGNSSQYRHYINRSPLSGFADLVDVREAANVHEMTEQDYKDRLWHEEKMYHFGSRYHSGDGYLYHPSQEQSHKRRSHETPETKQKWIDLSWNQREIPREKYTPFLPRLEVRETPAFTPHVLPPPEAPLAEYRPAFALASPQTHRAVPAPQPKPRLPVSPKKAHTTPRSPKSPGRRHCISCGSDQSPCWRPLWSTAAGQLCNSCGLRYKKTGARCLAASCGRIPAKGEWTTMKKRGKCVWSDEMDKVCYKCLHCDSPVEVIEK